MTAVPAPSLKPAALSWPHLLLALAVMAVWGTNFVVIRIGLDGFCASPSGGRSQFA